MNTNSLSNINLPSELSMLSGQLSGQSAGKNGSQGVQNNLHGSRSYADYAKLDDYNDINALQSLKYKSGEQKEAAIEETAKHFESLFVSMMIKSMRDANKVFSEGNMLQSSQSDFYQQMFDSQLAVSLSSGKGIGLAEVIKRQLTESQNLGRSNNSPGYSLNESQQFYTLEDYARQPFVSRENMSQLEGAVASIDQKLAELGSDRADQQNSSDQSNERPYDFSSPDKFIESLYPYAKQVEEETGIDARLMLAQSALETGWGQHQIYREDGSPSHNLFGIKSHRDWNGEQANILTTEYRNGVPVKEMAGFRSYPSYQESFKDYANFLRSNSRYETALENAENPKVFAQELQDAGYATDPKYSEKINRIIDRYMNFDALDKSSVDQGSVHQGSVDQGDVYQSSSSAAFGSERLGG